jgi:hypothetical protein
MTAEQRRQAIDFGKIRGTGMPRPSGMSSVSSRAHTLNLYFEQLIVSPAFFWRNKNRIASVWKSKMTPSSAWRGKTTPSSAWRGKTTPNDGSTQEI